MVFGTRLMAGFHDARWPIGSDRTPILRLLSGRALVLALGLLWWAAALLLHPVGAQAQAKAGEELRALSEQATGFRDQVLYSIEPNPDTVQTQTAESRHAADQGDWWGAIRGWEEALRAGLKTPDRWLVLSGLYDRAEGPDPRAILAAYLHAMEATKAVTRAEGLMRTAELEMALGRDVLALDLFKRAKAAVPSDEADNGIKALTGESLAVRRTRVESDRDVPRICLELTAAPDPARASEMADFITVEPKVEIAVTVRDKDLCVDGPPHGSNVTLTLRPGLPAEGGATLAHAVTIQERVRNRQPRVAFTGNAYILPAKGKREIAIQSVNVDQVTMTLLRVNDRAMATQLREGGLSSSIGSYDARNIAEDSGELVWQGTLDLESPLNQEATTAIPLDSILSDPQPGLYLVTVEDELGGATQGWEYPAQWLVITDLGLQTAQGADGLSVFARGLADGRPLSGVSLTLLARNNEELGTAVTDRNGMARFQPGLLAGERGRTPTWVMAYGAGGDFAFLDITGPAFDLSDRGVGGRATPGPLDAYLYTERGIYRPGETVHLAALLRDTGARALSGLPLTLKVLRPDGVEVVNRVLSHNQSGGYEADFPLLRDARTGTWTITAHVDPIAPPVGRVSFAVEDFVPQTMALSLTADAPVIDATTGDAAPVTVSGAASYLYGAPVAGQLVETEVTLLPDPAPFPGYKDYAFGLVQESYEPRRFPLPEGRTDETGGLSVPVTLDALPDTSHPLRAMTRVSVFDAGGRGGARTIILPVRHLPLALGLRPDFGGPESGGDEVAEGATVAHDILALDGQGAPVPGRAVDWVLYKEVAQYAWYQSGGSWNYTRTVTDETAASGRVETGADGLAHVEAQVDWGNYRMEVSDAGGSLAATSHRFHAGWWTSDLESKDTPDTMDVTLEGERYKTGERARLHIDAPFAGQALVSVVTDRVLDVLNVTLPDGGLTVELPVTEAWGVGAYVVTSAFRPGETPAGGAAQGSAQGPGRAMGVAWVPVDTSDRTLTVAIDAPEVIQPRQTVEVPVTVTGDRGPVYVTLAAVDEGILSLTDFTSPDPVDYYHGKRDLGLAYRDAYGRLLRGADGRPGRLRQGGDASGRQLGGLPDSSVKTVALFSGILRADSDGRVVVPLDIPDFNGRLRVMAVAYSANSVGAAEADMVARDPVVALASLPRFLAPGDRGTMTVTLDNVDGRAGEWTTEITASGAVSVEAGTVTQALVPGNKAVQRFTLVGSRVGSSQVTMTLRGPDGLERVSTWSLGVRPGGPRMTLARSLDLAPDGRARMDLGILDGFAQDTVDVALTLSTLPNLDPLRHASALRYYPYGCLEQTVSRSWVGLYGADLDADAVWKGWNGRDVLSLDISRIINMQRYDGGFALWDSNGGDQPWLSAYAMDFLLRARDKGVTVPGFALERGLAYLNTLVEDGDFRDAELPAAAYAHYVLARAGAIDLGRVRYFNDVYLARIPTGLGRMQTAAALALLGDRERAMAVPLAGLESLDSPIRPVSLDMSRAPDSWDYGSELRDRAAVLTLGLESGLLDGDMLELADTVASLQANMLHPSTQERGWLLMAAQALARIQGMVEASVDGRDVAKDKATVSLPVTFGQLQQGLDLSNDGTRPLRVVAAVDGLPLAPPPAESAGLAIKATLHTLDGTPLASGKVTQNDLLVMVIQGEARDPQALDAGRGNALLVVDLLPAGLEIENPHLGGADAAALEWLPELSPTDHVEARDDRFVAAVTVNPSEPRFTIAYVVRAVSPGQYLAPGVAVEDMYRPDLRANAAAGSLEVEPR
ncbi:MAG: alpha-2-macroglobulin family protein [Rhodospirillum sp.]|nr:alpha-2-macroglobulin family protein [Rhodospirillum sp.]MCF8489837.1 alpha-2-macroglobulin family protein [Rhodospirillum sp.]MCF8499668.1 alpha-2-macroglobulin family protein [Rhodospirillum sp.]